MDNNELIAERLREAAKRAEWYQTGEAKLLFAAADALEAATRVPVQGEPNDDREALAKVLSEFGAGTYLSMADAVLDAGFYRAAVPDAATEVRAERDAALAAVERVRALHAPLENSASAMYPTRSCGCGNEYPCETIAALDGAPEPAEPEWEAEKQYRAIIGRPWNILDRKAPKDVPIFEATGPKNERVVHLQRSEETHAWVERWEERDVRLGPWLPVEGESK